MAQHVLAHVGAGSPARAGIDPKETSATASILRFPRTRGDRPLQTVYVADADGVPPHARG